MRGLFCHASVYPGICGNPMPCYEHHVQETVDYENQTFTEVFGATRWTTDAKLTRHQFDVLKSTGLLRNDEEVAAFDNWERSL